MSKTISNLSRIFLTVIMAFAVILISAGHVHAEGRYELALDGEVFLGRTLEVGVDDTKNDEFMDVLSASSSNSAVLKVTTKTQKIQGQSIKTVYVTGKKAGLATLTVSFRNAGGKKATLKEVLPVLSYPGWVKTFTIDGKKVDLSKNKYEYSKKTGKTSIKVKLIPTQAHPIEDAEAYVYDSDTGNSKEIKVTKAMLKNGSAIKFPEKYDSLEIYVDAHTSYSYDSGYETYAGDTLLDYRISFTRPGTYKLTYKLNGGTNSSKNPVWYDGKVKLKDPKRTGYDFKGWYSDSKFKHRVKSVKNKNMTLYAKWQAHMYYVKFAKNGGKGSVYYRVCQYGKNYQLSACKYTREGYNFTGWNTKKDGSGKAYADKASFKNLTSKDGKTVSLYAQWELKKYKISYKGVPDGSKNPNRKTYTVKTGTFKLKDASNEGYDFKGWYSDSKKTKKITSVKKGGTGTKTIYSKWTPHKYVIVFNANGGKGSMDSMPSRKYGKSYTLTKNSFTRSGYEFAGWNTSPNGKGTKFKDGASVKNLTPQHGGKVTLYAQWKPIVDINDKHTYYFQGLDSNRCTLFAYAHMMIRRSILDGKYGWMNSLTKAKLNSDSAEIVKKAWGPGLNGTIIFSPEPGYELKGSCVSVNGMTLDKLKELLKKHPEGIELYDESVPHAVLAVSVDSNGVVYCIDSGLYDKETKDGKEIKVSKGIIKLTSSILGMSHTVNGNKPTQAQLLSYINKYWYLH